MSSLKIGIIAGLSVAILVIIVLLVSRTKKAKQKEEMEEINVRFNEVKSFPIAYKLQKAQEMAKKNEETAREVKGFYDKYEEVQKEIDSCEEMIEDLEDAFVANKKSEIKELKIDISEKMDDIEKEIHNIDAYLNKYEKEKDIVDDIRFRLWKRFGELKEYTRQKNGELFIAMDGVEERMNECGSLFTNADDMALAGDYAKATEIYNQIENEIKDMEETFKVLPKLIGSAKGTLPVLLEEVKKQYSYARQRDICLDSYHIEEKIETIELALNADVKNLLSCKISDERKHLEEAESILKKILNDIEMENGAFDNDKEILKSINENLEELKKLVAYVKEGYEKQQDRFGIEDLKPFLADTAKKIKEYEKKKNSFEESLEKVSESPLNLLKEINDLHNDSEVMRKTLLSYKMKIDKTTSDEQRAIAQLQKLQVVLNEVETKVNEYRLPTISDSYYEDLDKARKYIADLKEILNGVPIDIEKLNSNVDEAIDFIYKFYNNVNNIVGMAMMVENAIVFGNKYRSTYNEVDQELSKAEFYYMNGEYTKALTVTIKCMEKLYPNVSDKKMLENA